LKEDEPPSVASELWDSMAGCCTRNFVRPALMPFDVASVEARNQAIEALAASLPPAIEMASEPTKHKLEEALRAFANGTKNPNAALSGLAKQLVKLRVVISPLLPEGSPEPSQYIAAPTPLLSKFKMRITHSGKAMPQMTESGKLTQLSLEIDLDLLAERAQRIQIWANLLGSGPTFVVEPAHFTLVGKLRVWWDTSSGILQAGFLAKPKISFTGTVSARGCRVFGIPTTVAAIAERQLSYLDTAHPFTVPFKAPLPLRFINLTPESESLATVSGQVLQSIRVLKSLTSDALSLDKAIPTAVIKEAKALVMITHVKLGVAVSYSFGSGIIVCKLPSGEWSGPSSIQTVGGSFGTQFGVRRTDTVLCLFTDDAVRSFATGGRQVKIGGETAFAWGPLGREVTGEARISAKHFTTSFAYSHSSGYYMGNALAGEVLSHRDHENEEFYCKRGVKVEEILNGTVKPPPDDMHVKELQNLLHSLTTGSASAGILSDSSGSDVD